MAEGKDEDVTVGAAQVETVPKVRYSRTIRVKTAEANKLVRQAAALKEGERQCKGLVRLKPDMTRRAGPDNEYLRGPDGNYITRPCKRRPIIGGEVCPMHGGSAPNVRKKAQKRLLAMVEPSLIRLEALVQQEEHMPTALGAIRTVLERAGAEAIGALSKGATEKDNRPVINIGIAVGGINNTPPQVTVMEIPAVEQDKE